MFRSVRSHFLALFLTAALASPSVAGSDSVIGKRIVGYRAMGAALKGANDALRGGAASPAAIRQSAATIQRISREQYHWFPAGSGQRAGVKTAAKAEIWTNAASFRAAQDAFARQADAFQRTSQGGDVDLIRAQARRLGGTCKGCHDLFREARD